MVLLALFPLMSPDSAFTSDEGAYALQARANAEGRDDYEYKAQDVDPDGRWFPIVMSQRGPNGWFTYAQHPAYPRALGVMVDVFGERVGLHVLSALGAIGVAVAAWLLAREVDGDLSRPAFWIAALSPALVNAYLLWAHALSAAVAGLTLLAAVRVGSRGWRRPAALGLVVGVVAGSLLRSEGVLFALACGAVIFWLSRRVLSAAVPVLVAGATYAAEREWTARLLGGPHADPDRAPTGFFVTDKVRGAWHELVQGAYDNERVGLLAVIALLLLVVLVVPALRRGSGGRETLIVIGVAVALYGARWALARRDPVTGLLTAWPVAVVGVLCLSWRRAPVMLRSLVAGAAVFVAAVLATQYAVGGGLEWGGRFLSPVIVPAAVVAAAGLASRRDDRRVSMAVGVLAVITAAMALGIVGGLRARQDEQVAAVGRHLSPHTVTDVPALPRVGWRLDDETAWMLASDDDVEQAVDALRRKGARRITVVVSDDDVAVKGAEEREPALNRSGIRVYVVSAN